MTRKAVWLDCDPGHDDAMAILLAAWTENLHVVGISTLSGNQSVEKTTLNAARMVTVSSKCIPVIKGQDCPLVRIVQHDPEIHGDSGLEGSEELDKFPIDESVLEPFSPHNGTVGITQIYQNIRKYCLKEAGEDIEQCKNRRKPRKISIVATGALTNIALLLRLHPTVNQFIQEIVFMGGAIGIGNRHPVAEFNILCDPEAVSPRLHPLDKSARIVTDEAGNLPYPVVMIPLEVTHTALATKAILGEIQSMGTPFAKMVVDLMTFFKDTYERIFNFRDGPPVHDACAVAYLSRPEIFEVQKMRVDIISGQNTLVAGQTVCDIWGDSNKIKNVHVAKVRLNIVQCVKKYCVYR